MHIHKAHLIWSMEDQGCLLDAWTNEVCSYSFPAIHGILSFMTTLFFLLTHYMFRYSYKIFRGLKWTTCAGWCNYCDLWTVTLTCDSGQKHLLKISYIYTCPSLSKTMEIQAKHSDVIREKLTRLGHLLRDLCQILSFLANNETMKPRGSRDWGHSVAVGLYRESKCQRLVKLIAFLQLHLIHFLN